MTAGRRLFGREFVVDFLVLVEVLSAEEPDEILPCLLGGQLIGDLGLFTFKRPFLLPTMGVVVIIVRFIRVLLDRVVFRG